MPSIEQRPIRILAIGHCYTERLPRGKWYALRDSAPETDIRVITPFAWPDGFGIIRSTRVVEPRLAFLPMRTVGAGYGSRYFYTTWDLVRLLREHQPDIIHIDHEPWAVVCAQLAWLARSIVPKARLVIFSWWNRPRRMPRPWNVVHDFVLSRTATLLAGNQAAIGVHRALGYTGPIVPMPQLGVDLERFHPGPPDAALRARVAPADRRVIGFVGRVVAEKDVHVLIEALDAIRELNWHLLVVGSGPAVPDLQRLLESKGLQDRASFVGAVPQESVPDWIRCMDVLVLPSRRELHEQFGHVLVEAMACARVVVGSDSGEIPNTIGDAGLVFPSGDWRTLSEQLASLIRDPERLQSYGRRGYEMALAKYTDQALARTQHQIYAGIVNGR